MGFFAAIASGFKGYVNFRDRACRSEYWYFFLFLALANVLFLFLAQLNVLIGFLQGTAGAGDEIGLLGAIFSLATFLPALAMGVRRLHDIDRSGWWLLIMVIPLIGAIFLLVWACTRGTPGSNRFGPDSLGAAAAAG